MFRPIVVDWTNDLAAELRDGFQTTFENIRGATTPNQRKGGPAIMLFSSYDKTGSIWTHSHPSHMVLHRLSQFAKAALDRLQAHLFKFSGFDYQSLFVTPINEYDVLLHISNDANPRACEAIHAHQWLEAGSYSYVLSCMHNF